jgi:hypothetical protein
MVSSTLHSVSIAIATVNSDAHISSQEVGALSSRVRFSQAQQYADQINALFIEARSAYA